MLKSKIHRAVVTRADLHYVGSLTVDSALLREAGIVPNEKIDVVNINNGARFTTYAIAGEEGSGVLGVNGAAARLASPGDLVIVISYASVADEDLAAWQPRVVFVDGHNRPIDIGTDTAAAPDGLVRGDVAVG